MYCSKCGKEINNSSNYCDNCGNQIKSINSNEGIFANLSNFKYKRNWVQALGFCLVYTLLGILVAIIFGLFTIAIGIDSIDNHNHPLISLFGMIYPIAISITILYQKRIYKNFIAIILFILSILSVILCGIIGLIPVACLTTFEEQMGDNK